VCQGNGLGIPDRWSPCVPSGLGSWNWHLVWVVVMEETYTYNGEPIEPSKFSVEKTSFAIPKPNHNITFHRQSDTGRIDDSNKVGTLDFNGPALVFEGDAEESAKVFIDWVAQVFASRLKEEYDRGYEAAKKEKHEQ
jgi:hypothetical protein